MKDLKTGFDLVAKVNKHWKIKPVEVVNDGTKYGSVNNGDRVYNDIIGLTTPTELKQLERLGAIVFQDGAWRVARDKTGQIFNGEMSYPVSRRFLEFKRLKSGKAIHAVEDRSRIESLQEDPISVRGGVIV
jgi:hypothetical protein